MSHASATNNKRIAKNTLMLYFRMLLTMGVSLYTSRVVLEALGVTDFGIYTVVGGFMAMFAIISGSISASISRYLTFELGRGNKDRLSSIFSTSINIMIIISLIIIVLAESLGVWFVNYKMNFPADRYVAANWVFQLSLVAFVINLLSMPYNAAIIAHERMSAFAYIGILEAFGKLGIAFLIMIDVKDRLIMYAAMICVLFLIIRIVYTVYCKHNFAECTYHYGVDKPLIKEMFGFAGWNFIGATSAVLRNQGGDVIINLFYGTAVNAACGVAMQVNKAIIGFVSNFMTALNPQITKSYATGEKEYMMTLIYRGSRFSYYILLLLSLPIMLNASAIMSIWLKVVPDYAVLFVQLILVFALSESISNPLVTSMLATGNIRNYQIVVGGLQMLNLPVSYILLRMGFQPQWVYIVMIIISQLCLFARLYMLRGMIGLNAEQYLKKVYLNVILVTLIALTIPYFTHIRAANKFVELILNFAVNSLWTFTIIWFVGLAKQERHLLTEKILMLVKKIKNR